MKNMKKHILFSLIILIFVVSSLVIGNVIAKYINKKNQEITITTDKFYFTLDLIGDTNDISNLTQTHKLYGGDDKNIKFHVQNHYDELRYTDCLIKYDISYEITGSCDTILKRNESTITSLEKDLELEKTASDNTITDNYEISLSNYTNETTITITVSSTYPYTKTMKIILVLYTYEFEVSYYVLDSSSITSLFAEVIILTNINVDANKIIINWESINASSNRLQIDSLNESVGNIVLKNGYAIKTNVTKSLSAGEALSIIFYKTNPFDDFSKIETELTTDASGNYIITITEN